MYKEITLGAETFAGINFAFLVIFAKASAFGNSKSPKRESFSTRNHGYFLTRETQKFFKTQNQKES